MKRYLVTGGAGFIGSHLIESLLKQDNRVVNLDNFDGFYARAIKERNISEALKSPNYKLIEGSINDISKFQTKIGQIDVIVHLAAKAGVRPSIDKANEFFNTNVNGTIEILEYARRNKIGKVIYASSSSVYGVNTNIPWSVDDKDLKPISPYAASKVASENSCYVYSKLYDIEITALRFFTVFGPRQRPDLAIHKFVKSVINNDEIILFGTGNTSRDYTYVDDIVKGIEGAIRYQGYEKFNVFNLGNCTTVTLSELVEMIEKITKKKAIKVFKNEQPGDVPLTCANIDKSTKMLGYVPSTNLSQGIENFVQWFKKKNH